ncbi:hypothetical protein Hdeb2414_s0020g00552231 [Helianthus debilis subsp. tardiflorus]
MMAEMLMLVELQVVAAGGKWWRQVVAGGGKNVGGWVPNLILIYPF